MSKPFSSLLVINLAPTAKNYCRREFSRFILEKKWSNFVYFLLKNSLIGKDVFHIKQNYMAEVKGGSFLSC